MVKEWLKVMGAMALLAIALSVGVYTTSSTTTCVLCVSGVNAARIADAPRLLREKEDAQRAELAQRAAAEEEEARRRWQQAQAAAARSASAPDGWPTTRPAVFANTLLSRSVRC